MQIKVLIALGLLLTSNINSGILETYNKSMNWAYKHKELIAGTFSFSPFARAALNRLKNGVFDVKNVQGINKLNPDQIKTIAILNATSFGMQIISSIINYKFVTWFLKETHPIIMAVNAGEVEEVRTILGYIVDPKALNEAKKLAVKKMNNEKDEYKKAKYSQINELLNPVLVK